MKEEIFKNKNTIAPIDNVTFKTINDAIVDSAAQIFCYKLYNNIEGIKRRISETNLKTLEEYTGKTKEELDTIRPGICEKYNSLISELKNPNITMEEFKDIMNRTSKEIYG